MKTFNKLSHKLLVYPFSENRTTCWIKGNSAVCEITGYPIEEINKIQTSITNTPSKPIFKQKMKPHFGQFTTPSEKFKAPLDLRSIYHKNDDVTMAHLHLGILACKHHSIPTQTTKNYHN